jgi:hypothetical protein
MQKLKFTGVWNPPYPEEHQKSGGETFCRKLNGIPADIFMSASYRGTTLPSPKISGKWLDFVGGFTDEYFFNKEVIEQLSEDEQVILLDYIKKQRCANGH